MSAVCLLPEDLDELATLAVDLNFDDMERRSALLEEGSRDFNAVPGSGKTSLLAAKLLLLAKKWPHVRRGVCILSHTNVARDEIAQRLAATPEGAQLLNYPHFIGTIHGFVNQFFALPMMRSLGQRVDVIDNAVFADKAKSFLQLKRFASLRVYLEKQRNGQDIATTLFYRTAELDVHVESGRLPGAHTPSHKSLMLLKEMLTNVGVFRHRDMFAYADLAFKTCPHLVDIVHRRFPMVFIDEMQDTSWEQECLLNRIFDGKSVMQRFGDIDQKILSDEDNADQLTFPREGHGCISTSKRFGPAIAEAVGRVRVSGEAVTGEGEDRYTPFLLLYATSDVTKVIPHFGRLVLDHLAFEDIGIRGVKAMSARRSGESNVEAGRHLVDYWPAYGNSPQSAGIRLERFWELASGVGKSLLEPSLSSRVFDVRRALLLVLRSAGAPWVQDIRDARALPRAASEFLPSGPIGKLTRQLALYGERLCGTEHRKAFFQLVYTDLQPYLPDTLTFDAFKALGVFENAGMQEMSTAPATTKCQISHKGRSLEFSLGTIAGMKGETHTASLVLESYGGNSKKFDIALGLEYIAGRAPKKLERLPKTQQAQMRNLYVAMSRPATLLCLAVNQSRVSQSLRDALIKKGWHIETVA